MAAKRYELTDTQWGRIKDLIPRAKTGRPPKDDRMMLNAMLWLARSGAAWADIPARFGPHQTVYSRFCKWRDDGTLLRLLQELNADADYENLCIDNTSIILSSFGGLPVLARGIRSLILSHWVSVSSYRFAAIRSPLCFFFYSTAFLDFVQFIYEV